MTLPMDINCSLLILLTPWTFIERHRRNNHSGTSRGILECLWSPKEEFPLISPAAKISTSTQEMLKSSMKVTDSCTWRMKFLLKYPVCTSCFSSFLLKMVVMFQWTDVFFYIFVCLFSKTEHQHSGSPAADEQALSGHGLQLLQDGAHQTPDTRPQVLPRRRRLSLHGVPHWGNATYPYCSLFCLIKTTSRDTPCFFVV